MTLELKVGKKYVTRGGKIAEVVNVGAGYYPFLCLFEDGYHHSCTETGRRYMQGKSDLDLISEYIEPREEPICETVIDIIIFSNGFYGIRKQCTEGTFFLGRHGEGGAPAWRVSQIDALWWLDEGDAEEFYASYCNENMPIKSVKILQRF